MIGDIVNLGRRFIGGVLVDLGVSIDKIGAQLCYRHEHYRQLSRHRTLYPIQTIGPILSKNCKIFKSASLIGRVEIGEKVFIGNMCSLKGHLCPVRIGDDCFISEGVIAESRTPGNKLPGSVNIGKNVFIGKDVLLKSCLIDDDCYIGDNSVIEEGVMIGKGVFILPNTVVTAGSILPSMSVWSERISKKTKIDESQKKEILEKIKSNKELTKNLPEYLFYN